MHAWIQQIPFSIRFKWRSLAAACARIKSFKLRSACSLCFWACVTERKWGLRGITWYNYGITVDGNEEKHRDLSDIPANIDIWCINYITPLNSEMRMGMTSLAIGIWPQKLAIEWNMMGAKKTTWTYDNGNKLGIFGCTTKIWYGFVQSRAGPQNRQISAREKLSDQPLGVVFLMFSTVWRKEKAGNERQWNKTLRY